MPYESKNMACEVLPPYIERFPPKIEAFLEQTEALLQFLWVVIFHAKVCNC